MRLRIPVLFILVFAAIPSFAQAWLRPGYVVLTNGDTLHGLIDQRSRLRMGKTVGFQANGSGETQEYSPFAIREAVVPGALRLIAQNIQLPGNEAVSRIFTEKLFDGPINLYLHENESNIWYLIESADAGIRVLEYFEELRQAEGKTYMYRTETHKQVLGFYVRGCAEAEKLVRTLVRPEEEALLAIMQVYTACAEGTETKPDAWVRLQPEVFFQMTNVVVVPIFLEAGAMLGFSSVHRGNRMVPSLGFAAAYPAFSYAGVGGQFRYMGMIHYQAPAGAFRPRVGAGVHVTQTRDNFGVFFRAEAGGMIPLSDRMAASMMLGGDLLAPRPGGNLGSQLFPLLVFARLSVLRLPKT